jgi:hypothetical protein
VFQTKLPKVLLAYTTYIKQQWERDRRSVDMSRFRAVARVKTNKGFVTPATEAVHFTVDYLNKYDLPQLFPGMLIITLCLPLPEIFFWKHLGGL